MARLIALLERNLGLNWRDVVDWLRSQNELGAIEARLVGGDIAGVLSEVESAALRFAADAHHAFVTAGQTSAEWLDGKVPDKLIRFDQVNTRAVARAKANQLELVQGLVEEQRTTIRGVLVDGLTRGTNPREMARDIRSTIGLTESQASAVQSYRRALESGDYTNALGRELRDGRSDRTLLAARRDSTSLDADRVDSLVERYRTNFVAHRAEVIARTEALRAAHEGSEEAINQAVQRGDVEADQLLRTWNAGPATRYARADHQHLDGTSVKFGEAFVTRHGVRLRYPGDPQAPVSETAQCRCNVSVTLALA